MTTPVIFRKYPDKVPGAGENVLNFDFLSGKVVALFPTEPATYDGYGINCFVPHFGHTEADYPAVIAATRSATLEEYLPVWKTLTQVYEYDDLRVYKRRTPQMRAEFEKTQKEYRNA